MSSALESAANVGKIGGFGVIPDQAGKSAGCRRRFGQGRGDYPDGMQRADVRIITQAGIVGDLPDETLAGRSCRRAPFRDLGIEIGALRGGTEWLIEASSDLRGQRQLLAIGTRTVERGCENRPDLLEIPNS